MSSQIDECLRLLTNQRDVIVSELNLYKATQIALKQPDDQTCPKSQAAKTPTTTINPSPVKQAPDEARSEISSCLDSNYESDNNSVMAGGDTAAIRFGLPDFRSRGDIQVAALVPTFNSSDDSDATLHDVNLEASKSGPFIQIIDPRLVGY